MNLSTQYCKEAPCGHPLRCTMIKRSSSSSSCINKIHVTFDFQLFPFFLFALPVARSLAMHSLPLFIGMQSFTPWWPHSMAWRGDWRHCLTSTSARLTSNCTTPECTATDAAAAAASTPSISGSSGGGVGGWAVVLGSSVMNAWNVN